MTETHLNIDGKSRLEAFNMMLESPEFKKVFTEKTIEYLKISNRSKRWCFISKQS